MQNKDVTPHKTTLEDTINTASSVLGFKKFEHAKLQWNLLKVTDNIEGKIVKCLVLDF